MALKENWQAIGLALLYITIIASLSCLPSWKYLLFPELAALSYEVLLHPRGPWASQPWQLVFTLTATALLGVILTQNIDYSQLE